MPENNDKQQKEKDKSEKLREVFAKVAENKAPVAKDMVILKHVETKKQEVSQETLDLAKTLKDQVLEHDSFEELTNDEITILESFMGKRLFLTRIAIIVNQSRIPMGKEGLKKAELESILDGLVSKGYLAVDVVNDNNVYYLTERGEYRVQ